MMDKRVAIGLACGAAGAVVLGLAVYIRVRDAKNEKEAFEVAPLLNGEKHETTHISDKPTIPEKENVEDADGVDDVNPIEAVSTLVESYISSNTEKPEVKEVDVLEVASMEEDDIVSVVWNVATKEFESDDDIPEDVKKKVRESIPDGEIVYEPVYFKAADGSKCYEVTISEEEKE